jgi:hypothetical protein
MVYELFAMTTDLTGLLLSLLAQSLIFTGENEKGDEMMDKSDEQKNTIKKN